MYTYSAVPLLGARYLRLDFASLVHLVNWLTNAEHVHVFDEPARIPGRIGVDGRTYRLIIREGMLQSMISPSSVRRIVKLAALAKGE